MVSLLYLNDQYVFGQYPLIDGITCDKKEHFAFHYHVHLDIFVNGISYTIPAGIGIKPPDCIYWLHTHDISGIIHIESPNNRNFTLGQFFDIWGKEFNNNQIFDFEVDKSQNKLIDVYINGTSVNDLEYRDITFRNHQYITIVYGMQLPEIPAFEFPY